MGRAHHRPQRPPTLPARGVPGAGMMSTWWRRWPPGSAVLPCHPQAVKFSARPPAPKSRGIALTHHQQSVVDPLRRAGALDKGLGGYLPLPIVAPASGRGAARTKAGQGVGRLCPARHDPASCSRAGLRGFTSSLPNKKAAAGGCSSAERAGVAAVGTATPYPVFHRAECDTDPVHRAKVPRRPGNGCRHLLRLES
jgi:hypothetical protein